MSFYGKIYQGLSSAFRNFTFSNRTKNGISFPEDDRLDKKIYLEAGTNYDAAAVESGNRWIQIAVPEDGQTNAVDLYHAPPGGLENLSPEEIAETQTFTTIKSIYSDHVGADGTFDSENITPEIQEKLEILQNNPNAYLNFGTILTMQSMTFDKAGHIYKTEDHEYLMPLSPDLQLGINLEKRVQDLEYIVDGANGPDVLPRPAEDLLYPLDTNEENEEGVLINMVDKYPRYQEDLMHRLDGLEYSEKYFSKWFGLEGLLNQDNTDEEPDPLLVINIDVLNKFSDIYKLAFDGIGVLRSEDESAEVYEVPGFNLTGTDKNLSIPRIIGNLYDLDSEVTWFQGQEGRSITSVIGDLNTLRTNSLIIKNPEKDYTISFMDDTSSYVNAILGINYQLNKQIEDNYKEYKIKVDQIDTEVKGVNEYAQLVRGYLGSVETVLQRTIFDEGATTTNAFDYFIKDHANNANTILLSDFYDEIRKTQKVLFDNNITNDTQVVQILNANNLTLESNGINRLSTLEESVRLHKEASDANFVAVNSRIDTEAQSRENADNTNKTELTNLINQTKTDLQDNIGANKNELDAKDVELNNAITTNKEAIDQEVADREQAIINETNARNLLEQSLRQSDTDINTRIDNLSQALTDETNKRAEDDGIINGQITTLKSDLATTNSRVKALEDADLSTNINNLSTRMDALDNQENEDSLINIVKALQEKVTTLEAELAAANTRIDSYHTSPEEETT